MEQDNINGNTYTNNMDEQEAYVSKKPASNILELIKVLATNAAVNPETIKHLVDLQKVESAGAAKKAFNAAMARVQHAMPMVLTDRENTQTKSRYASYEQLLKYAKPIYAPEGFSLSFSEEKADIEGEIRTSVDIMHEGGYSKTRYIDFPLDNKGIYGKVNKTGPHAKASSFSYGRSYLMKMIFNIPTGDSDDGNGASQKANKDQLNDIAYMQKKNNISTKDLADRLDRKYGVKEPELLFYHQAQDLLKTLRSMVKKNQERVLNNGQKK
jgi:hypothetical protein